MRRVGDAFEERACAKLLEAGLTLVARNWHTRYGELDLVMREGNTLVFVEVRYRADASFGGAAASITARKRTRLIRAANGFLGRHAQYAQCACRFDVVTFEGDREDPRGVWKKAAFDAV